MKIKYLFYIVISILLTSCKDDEPMPLPENGDMSIYFGDNIDLDNLENYANQPIPAYITKDNGTNNPITDKGATLGRVLFYDKNLSADQSISCASCHKQEHAFGDNTVGSQGINGITGRQSMRLVNNRFAAESKYFWDERASSLEVQTTMPIRDHIEMAFSGTNGDLDFGALLLRLNDLDYYKELFTFVYGTPEITEQKMQLALAQFVRSIQSFDSKYDIGRATVNFDIFDFSNFTTQENFGKFLFNTEPGFNVNNIRNSGGFGCVTCHHSPEFDIDPLSKNNGVVGTLAGNGLDLLNTKSPSLRDLLNTNGEPNSPMMHTGNFLTVNSVIAHYANMPNIPQNTNLDDRLTVPNTNIVQNLNITQSERAALVAYLKTLTGTNLYTDPKWSNPFN